MTSFLNILLQLNCVNERGLTALMLACIRSDEGTVRLLLEAGADPDTETPPQGATVSTVNLEVFFLSFFPHI